MEVLLQFEDPSTGGTQRTVARVPVTQAHTVETLKRRVRQLGGFPAAPLDVAVLFNGQRLDDWDTLDGVGVAAAGGGGKGVGSAAWAGEYVYPNAWFLLGHRKAYPKVGSGCSWVLLRSNALERGAASSAWVLLLLVCLCNTLLSALSLAE